MSLVLLSGPRHSGKTGACRALAAQARSRGWSVGGVLAPAVFQAGRCVGYDAVDLATGQSAPLARLAVGGDERVGRFGFLAAGLALGRVALAKAAAADPGLVVVDEVGPLELAGGGWAAHLEKLTRRAGLTVFTVRVALRKVVAERWQVPPERCLEVSTTDVVTKLLQLADEL